MTAKSPKIAVMEHYLRPNLSVRAIEPLETAGQVRSDTVGSEFTRMVARSGDPSVHEFFEATTPAQVAQSLLLAGPEVMASGLVVLDAKVDPVTKRFGELTITTTENKTFGVSLHPLSTNARQNLNRLSVGPLASVFSWLANRTVLTVVADLPRWRAFMKACGREKGLVQGCVTASTIVEHAIRQGRIVLPPGAEYRPEDAVPILCHTYLGAYEGPANEDDYGRTFPGVERPVYRTKRKLYEWVKSRTGGRRHVSLHQVRLLKHEPRAILRGILDTVRENMQPEDEKLPSRELAKVNKRGMVAGLKLEDDRRGRVDVDFVQDENMLSTVPTADLENMDRKRRATLQFFGDLQDGPETQRAPTPGAFFRFRLLEGCCMYCGWTHRGPADLCDLAKRGAEHRISIQEVNCDHCFLHDHYVRACPTLHFRCHDCHYLGHLTIICHLETTTTHLRVFMVSCRVGLYTRLEREGPFAGPFGFGVALSIHLSERLLKTAREIRILNERRYASASDREKRARAEVVRFVLCTVPLLNVHYQLMKAQTDTWQEYWEKARNRLRYDQGRDPYRGPDAPWLDGYYREPGVQAYYDEAEDPVAEYEVDMDDAVCRTERIEGERAECQALLDRPGSARATTGAVEASGRNRFSASMISEPDDDEIVCLGEGVAGPVRRGSSRASTVVAEGLLQRQEALEKRVEEALAKLVPVPATSSPSKTPRRVGPPPRRPVVIGRPKPASSPYAVAGGVCCPRLLPPPPPTRVDSRPAVAQTFESPTSKTWATTPTATTAAAGLPRSPVLRTPEKGRGRCRPRREDLEVLKECEVRLTRFDESEEEGQEVEMEVRGDVEKGAGSSRRIGVTTRAAARRHSTVLFK